MLQSCVTAILATLFLTGTVPAHGQAPPASAQASPEIPGGKTTEEWILDELRAGKVAYLDERCGVHLDPRQRDDDRWRHPCRHISADFLGRVLTAEAWRTAPAHRGVRIVGALV